MKFLENRVNIISFCDRKNTVNRFLGKSTNFELMAMYGQIDRWKTTEQNVNYVRLRGAKK